MERLYGVISMHDDGIRIERVSQLFAETKVGSEPTQGRGVWLTESSVFEASLIVDLLGTMHQARIVVLPRHPRGLDNSCVGVRK